MNKKTIVTQAVKLGIRNVVPRLTYLRFITLNRKIRKPILPAVLARVYCLMERGEICHADYSHGRFCEGCPSQQSGKRRGELFN